MTVSDEMIERAAKALEKKIMQDTYEWTDEEFEIWWNKDSRFTDHIRVWGWFTGSEKAKCLYEARIALEAADAPAVTSAERERLRFEGDLDKWMKKLGAGITGYQPEAYAIMDLAIDDLVRLRAIESSNLST
jgi:hypothetical protein